MMKKSFVGTSSAAPASQVQPAAGWYLFPPSVCDSLCLIARGETHVKSSQFLHKVCLSRSAPHLHNPFPFSSALYVSD